MIEQLTELLDESPPVISILDIGAAPIEGHPEIYSPLLVNGRCKVIGFEPDQESCELLNQKYGPDHRYLPYILFDGSRRNFYITNTGLTSSLYEPDHDLRSKFHQLSEVAQVVSVEEVCTYRLDELDDLLDGIDYIKADAQGAEYEIYRNGSRVTKSACIIHTEAHLIPVYRNQPLLADQDRILREYGFQFHKLLSPFGRSLKPFFNKANPTLPLSQLTQVDAVYMQDIMRMKQLDPVKLLKTAIILNDVYRSIDMCHFALDAYDQKSGTDLAARYREEVSGDLSSGIGVI